MSRNICGNCANFKPEKGKRFFNCTYATHGSTSYGMQVRADTASCDAFKPIQRAGAPVPTKPVQARARPTGLCPWGRLILIAAIILILALLSWGVFTCASKGAKISPTPTTTPTLTPTLTGSHAPLPTPKPTPVPAFLIIGNYTVGQWVTIPSEMGSIQTAVKTSCVPVEFGCKIAPSGLTYVGISATVSNTGVKSVPLSVDDFILEDALGNIWRVSDYTRASIDVNSSISPGRTISFNLFFLIPDAPFSGLRVYWALMGDPLKWTSWNMPF
jgi:hypothetical protein